MDSGNSGSLQSSSGGDEEYDSRAETISSFFNNNPTGHSIFSMTNHPPKSPPPPQHHHHSNTNSTMFDPLSNYFESLSRPPSNPNPLLNLDPVWSKTLRSEPKRTEMYPILASPSSSQPSGPLTTSSLTVPFPPLAAAENNTTPAPRAPSSSAATTDQAPPVRNPKKRSRASRRAPTMVLTTDTTNFRAMVQEFTGIPAPPFASSPFPRSRIDLFGTPSGIRSNLLEHLQPSYLLRPFAQKLQPPTFLSSSPSSSSSFLSSSVVDAIASTSTNSTTCASNSTSINYQLSSQGLLNMQNPILNFQSLLQSSTKYPILGSKPQETPANDSHLKMGLLDEFGLTHGHVNQTQVSGLPNLVSPEGPTRRNDENLASWPDGVGTNNGDQSHLRSVNGNYDYSQNVNNGKLTFSASSSNFLGEKGPENVPARGEGMVESWICSSDS